MGALGCDGRDLDWPGGPHVTVIFPADAWRPPARAAGHGKARALASIGTCWPRQQGRRGMRSVRIYLVAALFSLLARQGFAS